MKIYFLAGAFFLSPLLAFANTNSHLEGFAFRPPPQSKHSVIKFHSNEDKHSLQQNLPRTIHFPTQIVRVNGNVAGLKLSCETVTKEIDRVFNDTITSDLFTYNIYTHCGYDPKTPQKYAVSFSIQSYFDPLTDEAVNYLKSWLEKYNGYKLFNTTALHIENAKGMIVSINLNAGLKTHTDDDSLMLYRQNHSSFHFTSNYDMQMQLVADIYNRFYSNDPQVILPFLDKWIFPYAGKIYYPVLRASNYLELQPERIFLMEKEGDIFISDLRYYFSNLCMKRNANERCL